LALLKSGEDGLKETEAGRHSLVIAEADPLLSRLEEAAVLLHLQRGLNKKNRHFIRIHSQLEPLLFGENKGFGSGSVVDLDSDPGGQKGPTKVEKIKKFHVLVC
jgi:hypothetical protein